MGNMKHVGTVSGRMSCKQSNLANVPKDEYTYIEGIYSCDNCGAYSTSIETVEHHATCKPGESKKWEGFYNEE